MADFIILEATLADAPTIARHRAQMFIDMSYLNQAHSERMQTESIRYLQQAMPAGHYVHFFCYTEGSIAAGGGIRLFDEMPWVREDGSVSCTQHAMVMNVYTEPTHRRLGLARLLMLHMHQYCVQRGIQRILLRASKFGRPLYESLGYQATNEMRLREAQMP